MTARYTVNPPTARLFGLDRVILGLSNWGDTGAYGAPIDPNSISYTVPFSVSGIAIEQSSQVDIATITSVTPDGKILALDTLSVERPMIGDIQGPFSIDAHESTKWSDVYEPSGSQVPETFGPDLNAIFFRSWGGVLVPKTGPTTPELTLVLYLKPPLYTPHKRSIYYSQGGPQALLAAPGAVYRALPVFGRHHAKLALKAIGTGGHTGTIKVSGVVGGGTGATTGSCYEADLGTSFSFTLAVPNTKEIEVDCRGLSWLLIHAAQANGTPQLSYKLEAHDF